jgi:hypothetical protein
VLVYIVAFVSICEHCLSTGCLVRHERLNVSIAVLDFGRILSMETTIYRLFSGDNTKSTVIYALRLLTDLLRTNEPFPVHSYGRIPNVLIELSCRSFYVYCHCCLGQLSNCVFLKSTFDIIENNTDDDELVLTAIKFLLALNLRFDSPHENPIMLTLVAVNEQISCRELIERLILLFNRSGTARA